MVGVLKGAVLFIADLMRHLTVPCEIDFMAVSSYGSETDSSGVVRILKDLDAPIEGRDVLIVEDIIDSGLTLQYLLRNLQARNPRSLEVCALLTKPERRRVDLPTRYVGFEIPNRFAIGYGLDHAQQYRNLDYVAALADGFPLGGRRALIRGALALRNRGRSPGTLNSRRKRARSGPCAAEIEFETVLQKRGIPDPAGGRSWRSSPSS